jgi:phenylpropionate dioxygenase-like ring-hydroxylating dioxygenase large terminal subunit
MNYKYYKAVASSSRLKPNQAIQVFYLEKPVVIFRTSEGLYAYEDYCPHRGLALSKGYIHNNEIHCAYHGWRFRCSDGKNTMVPVKNQSINCQLKSFYIKEKYNLVWISTDANAILPQLEIQKETIELSGIIQAKLLNTLENFLEGSHTHYVHDGLIRSKNKGRTPIKAQITQSEIGFKVKYDSEPPKGILTKLLPKKWQQLYAVSSYIHPNIAVLEFYNQKDEIVSRFEAVLNQEGEKTFYHARIFLHLGGLKFIIKPFAKKMFQKIIEQDKSILEDQQKNLNYFPTYPFHSDDTDLVGIYLHAWQNQKNNQISKQAYFCVYW